MKNSIKITCVVIAISFTVSAYSQRLKTGFITGLNISDIHSENYGGKWKYKPGTLQGISLEYNFYRIFSLSTGLNFSTINYEYRNYYSDSPVYVLPYPFSSSYVLLPDYKYVERMDFSFLSIPAQLKIAIPSRPQVNLAAGINYSFLLDYAMNYESDDGMPGNDFGYLYSAGISYPLTDQINISLNLRYMTGRKEFYNFRTIFYSLSSYYPSDFGSLRHGTYDFVFGMEYSGFLKNHTRRTYYIQSDTINENIFIAYRGGINISGNSCEYFREKYSLYYGPSAGLGFYFRLSPGAYFQTGISFERTGYSLRDSSDLNYRYLIDDAAMFYVKTRISADYFMIPALMHFQAGKYRKLYLNTGPYISLKLNARCKGEAFSESKDQEHYTITRITVHDEIEGLLRDNDMGWIFGGGVSLPFSENYSIDLGLQYRTGLKDVFKSRGDYSQPETDKSIIRNSVISLTAGLQVPVYRRRNQ